MSNKSTNLVAFIVGLTIGSIATWRYVKIKYEQIAQKEINSVKVAFSNRGKRIETNTVDDSIVHATQDLLTELGYRNYTNAKEDKEVNNTNDRPYIITPEEFGEFSDYESISLTYYSDSILADDNDELVDDIDVVVGLDSLNHFGEYEEDSVFVRNDALKCDYEILLDQGKYSDIIKTS